MENLKNYKITYENGNTLNIRAYSVEYSEETGNYYVCSKAYVGDGPSWSVIHGKYIKSIEEV